VVAPDAFVVGTVNLIFQPQAMPGNQPVEGLARNELHGDEIDPAGRINVVDGDDIGMIQDAEAALASWTKRGLLSASATFSAGSTLRATTRSRRVSRQSERKQYYQFYRASGSGEIATLYTAMKVKSEALRTCHSDGLLPGGISFDLRVTRRPDSLPTSSSGRYWLFIASCLSSGVICFHRTSRSRCTRELPGSPCRALANQR
jgi:hypothetical protein